MGSTYIIFKEVYSEKAARLHGDPRTWHVVAKIRQRPPSDEESFRLWLWNLVKKYGSGTYRIVRTQAKGERAGFHPVFYGYLDEDYLTVQRSYQQYKGIPGLPPSRDLYFKRPQQRLKFRKRGGRF